jgi:CheY-like chemotaxis protein
MKYVLIVDDEQSFLKTFAEGVKLCLDDWYVLTAENGKRGAEIINSVRVDLVVTDLRMPLMDGYELAAYIRGKYPDMPIIAMTADSNYHAEEKLHAMGIDHCLNKPFRLSEAVSIIRQTVSGALSVYPASTCMDGFFV